MRKTISLWIVMLALVPSVLLQQARAQEENKPETNQSKPAERHTGQPGLPGGTMQPIHPYRVEFLITELQDGRRINSRRYAMLLNAGNMWNQMKIGTRVPAGPDVPGQFLDVGTNINCRVIESGADIELDVHTEFSNFFSAPNQDHSGKPIIQQISINGNTLVASGKPIIVGLVDDPNSDRQFQLESTVTKLR